MRRADDTPYRMGPSRRIQQEGHDNPILLLEMHRRDILWLTAALGLPVPGRAGSTSAGLDDASTANAPAAAPGPSPARAEAPALGRWTHGYAAFGPPAMPADFAHFAYADPSARKGGTLFLRNPDRRSTFDKYNPFTIKGQAPAGLSIFMFETLAVTAGDEAMTMYGLLAQDMLIAPDRSSITFRLHPRARFWNGDAVTAQDVRHSFEQVTSRYAAPGWRVAYAGVERAVVVDERTVRFDLKDRSNDTIFTVGSLAVFSRKWGAGPDGQPRRFDEVVSDIPITSGPFTVGAVDSGKRIEFRLNPDYWARDLPVRRGFFNFERVVYRYYKDQAVAREAFKAGEFDFFKEYSARAWSRQHAGAKWSDGRIRKKAFKTATGQGLQAYILNLRRPLFQDRRVREALGLTYDFDTLNKSGQYQRSHSLFNNSAFAAEGMPSPGELRLLQPWRAELPPEVFGPPFRAPLTGREPNRLRANLLRARELLAEAGWTVAADGQLRNAAGQAFTFEYMLPGEPRPFPEWEKNLAKLGITLKMRAVDFALYRRRLEAYDFDVVAIAGNDFTLPDPAGLSQMLGSASVDEPGGNNLRGVKSPVVDALLKALAAADTLPALRDAARALDRVVMWNHWQIPDLWTADERVSYWNRFAMPAVQPLHFSIDTGALPWPLVTWWLQPGAVR
jgi:peptide/nickel transport system substrate-binding protein/microcin C transport system substrate-binding protein